MRAEEPQWEYDKKTKFYDRARKFYEKEWRDEAVGWKFDSHSEACGEARGSYEKGWRAEEKEWEHDQEGELDSQWSKCSESKLDDQARRGDKSTKEKARQEQFRHGEFVALDFSTEELLGALCDEALGEPLELRTEERHKANEMLGGERKVVEVSRRMAC